MTTKIDTISSDIQITFSSTPSVQTMISSDNSTKLASIGFVSEQGLNATTYLDKTSTQTITGNYTITQPTIATIDTLISSPLYCGQTTDILLTIDYSSLRIKSYLQTLSNYWSVGNASTGSSTATIVDCQKVQTGQVDISSLTTQDVEFFPAFVSKPAVLISVQSKGSTAFTPPFEWAANVTKDGFTASSSSSGTNLVLNWMAIGT